MFKLAKYTKVVLFFLLIGFSFAKTGLAVTGDICQDYYKTGSNTTNCVKSADINAAAVTGAKIASGTVAGSNIANGTVTRGNLVPIAKQVIVASSGGDYTNVSAALAAISPSSSNPYVIEVMPGTYTDNITMKSYVHLRGAGREVTTIQSSSSISDTMTISSLINVEISGLTISGGGQGNNNGINMSLSSAITIHDNTFTNTGYNGILDNNNSSTYIFGNIFTITHSYGIYSENTTSSEIRDNTFSGVSGSGVSGMWVTGSVTSVVKNNIISGFGNVGLYISNSSPTLINNKITGNGSGVLSDISFDSASTPNISFNVYNSITGGGRGLGQYNVTSTGGVAPAP